VHPELGRIEVDCQVLFTEDRGQTLLVMTTRPGTESHSKLQLLSVIGQQQFTR
jgi:MmyB-like transcription regulator ligand binding domain